LTVIITGVVYAITIVAMCIFYMTASILLLRRMKASQIDNSKRTKNLQVVCNQSF
jgi:hypothetical protein